MSALIYNNTQIGYEMSSTYGKLFLNSDVCLGYGISKQALNDNLRRNQDELIEGTHYIYDYAMTNGGRQRVIKWTTLGVYHLGFFIKSKQAKEFRKFMSKIANVIDPYKLNNTKNVINGYKSQIVQHNQSIARLEDRIQALASENEKLKIQHTKMYEENIANLVALRKIKSALGIDYQMEQKYKQIENILKG